MGVPLSNIIMKRGEFPFNSVDFIDDEELELLEVQFGPYEKVTKTVKDQIS